MRLCFITIHNFFRFFFRILAVLVVFNNIVSCIDYLCYFTHKYSRFSIEFELIYGFINEVDHYFQSSINDLLDYVNF